MASISGTISTAATFSKAWAAAIAAPLADWGVDVLAEMLQRVNVMMPDEAHIALVSLIVGVIVYAVPNKEPA